MAGVNVLSMMVLFSIAIGVLICFTGPDGPSTSCRGRLRSAALGVVGDDFLYRCGHSGRGEGG